MSESEPLIKPSPFKGIIDDLTIHKIKLEDLYSKLGTTADGLTSDAAKEKRKNSGLNYIDPPIQVPTWLCCLLPCFLSAAAMKQYNECVPDYGYVRRNGKWLRLDCISIVPGDVVRVGKGERVPADIRLIKVIANETRPSQLSIIFLFQKQASACVFDGSSIMGKSDLIGVDPDKSSDAYLDSPNIAFLGYLCIAGIVFPIYLTLSFLFD